MGERAIRARKRARNHARDLRTNQTDAESKLWWELRGRRDDGLRFRRQHPVAPYILDFAEMTTKLCVELDGVTHGEPGEIAHDRRRTRFLVARGWTVFRLGNDDVFDDAEECADSVIRLAHDLRDSRLAALAPPSAPSGHLPPQVGEGS